MTSDDLTPAQKAAVRKWWDENNQDEEFPYADNDRYAVVGNAAQEAEYEEIRLGGCCGSCDVELQCEDGTVLLMGFNYGH